MTFVELQHFSLHLQDSTVWLYKPEKNTLVRQYYRYLLSVLLLSTCHLITERGYCFTVYIHTSESTTNMLFMKILQPLTISLPLVVL